MSRLAMINTMKTFLKTERPHRDGDGHKVKVLFLKDYVLYALLREKKDFTNCATDKSQAISIALDWLSAVERSRKQLELNNLESWDLKALKYKIGVDFTLEDLVQLEHAIKNQIDTLNVAK
jgi:hypothetical protein